MVDLPTEHIANKIESLIAEISAYQIVIANPEAQMALSHLKSLVTSIKNELVETKDSSLLPESKLTARECEILKLVMNGSTNKEIAYKLSISPRTVQFHLNSIFNKTTTNTRTGAVTMALKNGWL